MIETQELYQGKAFSPVTQLKAGISSSETTIQVNDASVFPDAPNLATIWDSTGEGETIRYTGKTSTALTGCTRGYEGPAKSHLRGDSIARNFNNADYMALIEHIRNLENNKVDKQPGKGLSTNDYTAADKQKLNGVDSKIENVKPSSTTIVIGSTGWVSETGGKRASVSGTGATQKSAVDVLGSSGLSEFMTKYEVTAIWAENSSGNVSIHIRMVKPETVISSTLNLDLRLTEMR